MGSSTYLTDNFGRPSHYYETLPFGEMMVEHNQSKYYKVPYPTTNTGSYDNKWKFNGKELDDATQLYYYGARYYDPRISIFISVDPLAEQTMEPYLYTGNNPIMFTDPTGMAKDGIDSDYRLNRDGSFTLLRETTDDFDRIYNQDGSDNITVDKSFLMWTTASSIFSGSSNSKERTKKVYDLGSAAGSRSKSERIFKFFAKNTVYEYGLNTFKDVKTGEASGFLSTSFQRGTESAGVYERNRRMDSNSNLIITRDMHSHPGGGKYSDSDYPSGYGLNSWKNPGTPGMKRYDRLKDDALYYHEAKQKYGNRVPDNFEIFVPKAPTVKIFYNDKKAVRTDNGVAY